MAMYNIIFSMCLVISLSTQVLGQTIVDSVKNVRLDLTQYLDMAQGWASTQVATNVQKLGSTTWYSTQLNSNITSILRSGRLDLVGGAIPIPFWALNLIAPPMVNISTVQAYLKPSASNCRPDHLRTLISTLSAADLELLANGSSATPFTSINCTKSCLKMFSMIYLLKRNPTTLTMRDIDWLLPIGLALVPPYLLRKMPHDVLKYMVKQICQQGGSIYPAKSVPALHLRALIEQLIINYYANQNLNTFPAASDMCRCLPYIRRPVFEAFATQGYQQQLTTVCYQNESLTMVFSGEFYEPAQSSYQRNYMSTVFYPREQCRYGRAPMVEWSLLSKIYHKVNMSYYNVINCMSLDRREDYRKDNVSVSWDMLDEVNRQPMSINDRESTCISFRGDFNLGNLFLTEQSLQQITHGIVCLGNFEIRRIPNVYLCTMKNLQRFADTSRPIQDEVKFEVARKCSEYIYRKEGVLFVASAFGDLLRYLPIQALRTTDTNIRKAYYSLAPNMGIMSYENRRLIAKVMVRPYNDTYFQLIVPDLCSLGNIHMMSTVTFINAATSNCSNYGALTFPQKLVAAKAVINSNSALSKAISTNNLTWALLTSNNLLSMLEALPTSVYSSFISYEVIDDAIQIVQQVGNRISSLRVRALSNAIIKEFKRRAVMKYGDEKYFPYEMTEPLLDSMPCQLLMGLGPLDISAIQSDMVSCRTLSRRWASCPQFLMKTQTYRDYVCNVFFKCGNQALDFDHFVDDIGTYCFCNITDTMIASMTVNQILATFPVVSELPNCLSQLARIQLTTRIIDAYPPKSYVTSLSPSGQEAWLTELGKLSCNLNAAIISERYSENTFGSQTEYLGRACCFNWTSSGTPLQSRLISSVYYNKTADDMWDILKMCERMFNTTAYIIKSASSDSSSKRKKRETIDIQKNCSLLDAELDGNKTTSLGCNIPDDMEEGDIENTLLTTTTPAPLVAPALVRRKRDVVIDGFVWNCPLLKAMTKDALRLISYDDVVALGHLDFIRCLRFITSTPNVNVSIFDAVILRVKTELSRYFSFCDTDPRVLVQLGYAIMNLKPENISCTNITDEVMISFGRIETVNYDLQRTIASRYYNLSIANGTQTFTVDHMAQMGHMICAVDQNQINKLTDSEFETLVPMISRLKNCTDAYLQIFFNRASKQALFGAVSGWSEEHFYELGLIAAGMSSTDLTSLSNDQLRWMSDSALQYLAFGGKLASLSTDQLQSLLPEQVRLIMPSASGYPLNNTLSKEQLQALVVAELDDMYTSSLAVIVSGARTICQSTSITIGLQLLIFLNISLLSSFLYYLSSFAMPRF